MSDVKYEYGCEVTSTKECPLNEEIRADERINTVQFIIDEFNRRTVCLGRAEARTYVINTLTEILKELKEQKK